ncbi:ABC transporter ATP-binding protein [Magnetospira sp. QH-2]|uniref:ABC transporter ATP-binding protein n=1 Tax=Magnetospira sp. (strain QH-2) TaxID=1288970 RepID=UPI0003E81085|nr:ABC transporter ATP-binding protein [Magnetospira sp. QH-2]CCQ73203.1 Putative outer membrane-specific lipoprotein transporter subunit; ATP-binding component of ABC superfamily [Magnetospira sp. QH-2]
MRPIRPTYTYALSGLRKTWTSETDPFHLAVENLTVEAGDIVVLRGESGCGKSTFLDILGMTLQPDVCTKFEFVGRNRKPLDARRMWEKRNMGALTKLRRRNLGYVMQTGGLLPYLTVRQNIELVGWINGQDIRAAKVSLVEHLGLMPLLDRKPAQLSVGQRQRVAIARALIHRPKVILADEPTASLDPHNAERVFALLVDLVRTEKATAVIATHDWELAKKYGCTILEHALTDTPHGVVSTFSG